MDSLNGKPLSFWLYPPYPWRGPKRRRLYATLRFHGPSGSAVVTDETGEIHVLADNDELYPALVALILAGRRTVYCDRLRFGNRAAGIVYRAMLDNHASVLYSPRRGLMGYTFRRGRRSGALLGMGVWGNRDGAAWTDARFLTNLRQLSDVMGCGDYDTAGALGQATLTRFWQEAGLPYQFRLQESLQAALNLYQIGGRVETPGLGRELIPHAIEWDLKSAYPTAVARGLPAGRICYHNQRHEPTNRGALFGLWRIFPHTSIEYSPVGYRQWGQPGTPISWTLDSGAEYTYGGWLDEIAALRATGNARVEFLFGWSWPRLDTMLAPWIDRLVGIRQQRLLQSDRDGAELAKLVANAAIGRWGMDPEQYLLVPDEEHELSKGDFPLQVESGEDNALTGAWVRLVDSQARHALPYHWVSYARMAVRMELWRKSHEVWASGRRVLLTNFDGLLSEASTGDSGSDGAMGETIRGDGATGENHPWQWVPKARYHASVIAPRSVVWEDEHGTQVTMPGASQAMRMAILVDHQRKREAKEQEPRESRREAGDHEANEQRNMQKETGRQTC